MKQELKNKMVDRALELFEGFSDSFLKDGTVKEFTFSFKCNDFNHNILNHLIQFGVIKEFNGRYWITLFGQLLVLNDRAINHIKNNFSLGEDCNKE